MHLTRPRPSLLAAALRADPHDRSSRSRTHASLGAKPNLRFSVLHWYEMVLSAG